MTDRGLAFSTPLVRALREGRKTVTRRVVNLSKVAHRVDRIVARDDAWIAHTETTADRLRAPCAAGDRLYVKETFAPDYFEKGGAGYRADWTAKAADVCPEPKWTSSRFMPKAFARTWLVCESVTVERLHSITEDDAVAEGIQRNATGSHWCGAPHKAHGFPTQHNTAREAFASLWDSINGKTGPWASNPWVWRIAFRVDHAERAEAAQ